MRSLKVIVVILLLAIGISALFAGYGMMSDPTGSKLGMSTSLLSFSPFKDFLIPGITLFVANGILSLLTVLLILIDNKRYAFFIAGQGIVLAIWIFVQMLMLQTMNMLQLTCLVIASVFVVAGLRLKNINNWKAL